MENEEAACQDRPNDKHPHNITPTNSGQSSDTFLDPPVTPDGKRLQGSPTAPLPSPEGLIELIKKLPEIIDDDHLAMLKASGISHEVIAARKYRSVHRRDTLAAFGFSDGPTVWQRRTPCLLIPLYGVDGLPVGVQIRPDRPRLDRNKKPVKYEIPLGAKHRIGFQPGREFPGPGSRIFISEGAKNGDAFASVGEYSLTVSGVDTWSSDEAFRDLKRVDWKGREVIIAFDSDAATNPRVTRARADLAEFLTDRGAIVKALNLPPGANGKKQGPDDFLGSGKNLDDLMALVADPPPVEAEQVRAVLDQLDAAEALGDEADLIYSAQRFWRFPSEETGVWVEIPEESITRALQIICREARMVVKDSFVKGALNQAKGRFFRPIEFDRIDRHSIPAANGVLRYDSGKWTLSPYSREDYRRVRLPIIFDPEATCPRFVKFLNEVFEPQPGTGEEGRRDAIEKTRALLEFMALSLTSSTEFETAALLVGSGGNGKSVVIKLIEGMVGAKHRSAVTMRQLENKFQRAHLDGKLINLMFELGEGSELPDDTIKGLISGETTTAEFKNKAAFELSPICKFWIATNHMPSTRDLSEGLFRRFLILQFLNRFDDKPERDTQLVDKLAAEASGILNILLKALAGVYERGGLTKPRSSVFAVDQWKKDADQVASFIDDEMILEAGSSMKTGDLYQKYRLWAVESGIRRILGKKGLVTRLEKFGIVPGKVDGARGVHGIRERAGVDELAFH